MYLPYNFKYETVIETRTSEDLKKKYEVAKLGKNEAEGMIEKLKGNLTEVHKMSFR